VLECAVIFEHVIIVGPILRQETMC